MTLFYDAILKGSCFDMFVPLKYIFDSWCSGYVSLITTLRLRQNGWLLADDTFKYIFFNENRWISIKISLNFVSKHPFNNIPALVQIMAWRRPGDKPLSEPMMVSLLMYIHHSASVSLSGWNINARRHFKRIGLNWTNPWFTQTCSHGTELALSQI